VESGEWREVRRKRRKKKRPFVESKKREKKTGGKLFTFQLPRLRVPAGEGKGEEDDDGAEVYHRGGGRGARKPVCVERGELGRELS